LFLCREIVYRGLITLYPVTIIKNAGNAIDFSVYAIYDGLIHFRFGTHFFTLPNSKYLGGDFILLILTDPSILILTIFTRVLDIHIWNLYIVLCVCTLEMNR
jgi:hypothetical protein